MLHTVNPEDVSDEAHFYFSGTVDKQQCRFWFGNNAQELHQRPQPQRNSVANVFNCCVIWFVLLEENGECYCKDKEQNCTVTSNSLTLLHCFMTLILGMCSSSKMLQQATQYINCWHL